MFEESVWASMTSWLTPAVFFVLLNVVIGTIAFTHKKQIPDSPQSDSHPHPQQQQKQAAGAGAGSSSPLLQRLKSINFYSSYRSHESPSSSSSSSSVKIHPNKSTDSEPLFDFEPILQSQNYEIEQNQEKIGSLNGNRREKQGNYFFEQNPSQISNGQKESFDKSPEFQENEVSISRLKNVEQSEEEEEVYSVAAAAAAEQHIHRSISDTKPTSGEIPRKLPTKMKKSASMKSAFNHFETEDILEARRPATVNETKKKKDAADVDNEVDAKADDFIYRFKQQLKLQRLDSIIRYKEMIGKGKEGGG